MIYLDNASTSFPKPREVSFAIQEYLNNYGVTPGRGSYYLAHKAEELVIQTREMLAQLIGAKKETHVVFTQNATHSLNLVIKGFLKQGDHVLICSYSHNSVIRPIDTLKRKGLITYDIFEVNPDGSIDKNYFCSLIKENTRLVIGNHASNVIGVISQILDIAPHCQSKNIRFMLDCTQSVGYASIDVDNMPIDFLAGTGHKTLFGPSGIGFLYIKNPRELETLMEGGSGGNYSFSPFHPSNMPFKYEAGTPNTTCIAGLKGALDYIAKISFEEISKKSMNLTKYAWEQLTQIDEIVIYGTNEMKKKVPIISFNVLGTLANEIAQQYANHGICLRSGLQCTPIIHKQLKTIPTGTLRISTGHYNKVSDIDKFIQITKTIIQRAEYGKTCA